MSETTFHLPDLGEGLTEATLVAWLVETGQEIAVDQPIAEVETAKSVVEVPTPYGGTVAMLHGAPGEEILVGAPLITVGSHEAAPSSDAAARPAGAVEGSDDAETSDDPGGLSYREEERAGTAHEQDESSGNVLIGYGTQSSGTGRRRRRRSPAVVRTEASEPAGAAPRVSSPLVRRLAREHGIDLTTVSGSGSGGLIVRADVTARLQVDAASASVTPNTETPDDAATADAATGLAVRGRTPITGIRKAIATTLSRSRREIPEATVWQDVDLTDLVQLRADLKANGTPAPSVPAILSRIALAGLARYPELATRIDEAEGRSEIVGFEGVNLGFAAQTPRGLVVPVVRRADQLSARELHAEFARLAEAAREGTIDPAELRGGTFTVNNYGVFNSDGATPIINHPEVAILGIGRTLERPWVVDGELAVRRIATVTIAFDHRVCDGQSAGGFLDFVVSRLQDPRQLLFDL